MKSLNYVWYMTKWGKTAVKQSGTAGRWIGANRKRMCAQAGSSSLPPPQSHSQQVRVNTTKSHMRQWLHTSDDLTAATVHPVGTLFFFTRGDLTVADSKPSTSAQRQVKLTVQITSRKHQNTETMTCTFLHCTMRHYTLSHVSGTDHKTISLMTIRGLSHFSDLQSWAVRLRESRKNTSSAAKNFTIHPSVDIKDQSACFPSWAYEIGLSCNR